MTVREAHDVRLELGDRVANVWQAQRDLAFWLKWTFHRIATRGL